MKICMLLVGGVGVVAFGMYYVLTSQYDQSQPQPQSEPEVSAVISDDQIVVTSPVVGAEISSPVIVTGEARGYWFFEASFPVVVVDWDGLIIGQGIAQAEGDWMTEDFVPFRAVINYDLNEDTPYRRGAVILQKDNPSGLPENDAAVEIPVRFK